MASNNPQTPRQVQNAVGTGPENIGAILGFLIWAGLFGFLLVKYISVFTSLNQFLALVLFLVGLGSVFIFMTPLVRLGERISQARRESRANDRVEIQARVLESRLHWRRADPRRHFFLPIWSLKYEFEFDHVTYQSTCFQFDHYKDGMFGSVAAIKRMVVMFPEGSIVPGYFRPTAPTAIGLSMVAVTLEPSPRSYTTQECREQELLP
jgi:hypothetical protein